MDNKTPTTKREDILLAAARIINDHSVAKFTLEAVAGEAGVSKGGLLYHFPNKEALVKGLLDAPMEHFTACMEQDVGKDASVNGKWCRAYTIESFSMSENMKRMWIAGLISALALNRALLQPLAERFRTWQENIEEDGIDPVEATTIRLVADGIWFLDLFGISIIDEQGRKKLLASLIRKSGKQP